MERYEQEPDTVSIDRISNLPKFLLIHILSLIPIKTAVQTCVLSRTWRYLWTSVPVLDFDEDLFLIPECKKRKVVDSLGRVYSSVDSLGRVGNSRISTNFMDFVNNVLFLRHGYGDGDDLRKFRLRMSSKYDSVDSAEYGCEIARWVSSAIRYNVRNLDLDIFPAHFEFPHSIFASKALRTLILCLNGGILDLPTGKGIGFATLRTLYVSGVYFEGENVELFSNCPLLEHLTLTECNIYTIDISSQSLKWLIIDHRVIVSMLRVCAPNLISFKYTGICPLEGCDLENLSSLANADIDIYKWDNTTSVQLFMSNILRGVFEAEVLTLSKSCISLLSKDPNILELQPICTSHLKCLKLTASLENSGNIKAIARLLKSYTNIETLVIDIQETHTPSTCYHIDITLLDHLKEVEIRNYGGRGNELKFVKCLLENAKVMERMLLFSPAEWSKNSTKRMLSNKKLLTFPRASSSVGILFS